MSLLAVLAFGTAAGLAQDERPGQLFERAYYLEQAKGDLEGAVELYENIVESFPQERGLAARALLRIGLCHERLGVEAAVGAYRRLIQNYADQEDAARIARERLTALRSRYAGPSVDLPSGAILREIVLADGRHVGDNSAAISPDGRRLAYVDFQLASLVIYDLPLQKPHLSVPLSVSEGNWVYRWAGNGRYLAFDQLKGEDRIVDIVDADSGHVTEVFHRARREGYAVDWAPDGLGLLVDAGSENGRRLLLVDVEGSVRLDIPKEGWSHRLSPTGAWIAFAAGEDDEEVYVSAFPGTGALEKVPVSPHSASDRNPVWSPDGRYLAFRSNRAKSWDLWVVEIEQGRPAAEPLLVHKDIGEEAQLQAWLPDGRLAFTKRSPLGDIWIQPVDPGTGEANGAASLLRTEVRGQNGQPRWSPDGRRIAFRSRRERNQGTIFVADLVDGTEHAIEIPEGHQNADWFPDGERLVFAGGLNGLMYIQEIDWHSRDPRVLIPDLTFDWVPAPDVSPDGRKILFHRITRVPSDSEHFIHELNEQRLRVVPRTEGTFRGRWSPDGEWIAIPGDRSLCVIRPSGADKRCLIEIAEPERFNQWSSWSPDGRLLAYPRGRLFGNSVDWDVWIVSVESGSHRKVGESSEINPWWVDWSPDGRHLALASVGDRTSFWMLENFFRPKPAEP